GIAWRCLVSVSLRDFFAAGKPREGSRSLVAVDDARRLPHEIYQMMFGWVLKLAAERGLVRGQPLGIDASPMEANAALRMIVRRQYGRSYREMLTQMARESGTETPGAGAARRYQFGQVAGTG
ncbi:MAG: hypothetical protein ACREFB_03610, partial [Stellaceae bacterium]